MAKTKIFFYINLILKIIITCVVLLTGGFGLFITQIFQNSSERIGSNSGFSIPAGILSIIALGCFILWYFIIFCERVKEYQKFKKYYVINVIAEIILACIAPVFFNIVVIIISIMGIIYFLLKRKVYLHSEITAERMEKMKEILRVSNRIKLERVQNVLNLDDKSSNSKIIEWAKEFGFRLDGEYLIINQESIAKFIEALDDKFIEWEKMEKGKDGKL